MYNKEFGAGGDVSSTRTACNKLCYRLRVPLYSPRTDGVWYEARLMSRQETQPHGNTLHTCRFVSGKRLLFLLLVYHSIEGPSAIRPTKLDPCDRSNNLRQPDNNDPEIRCIYSSVDYNNDYNDFLTRTTSPCFCYYLFTTA